jgi:glycerol kinase
MSAAAPVSTDLFDCRDSFVAALAEVADRDSRVVVVVNDSVGSSKLGDFRKRWPERTINVGIAEQNMVGVGSGLANGGKIPFVSAASCFLTGRALEQIKADVAYSNANVKLVGQSPGVGYGELGPTHHSIEDFGWLRLLPNLAIVVPADPWQTAEAVKAAAAHEGPVFIRVSRFGVPKLPRAAEAKFAIGKAETLRTGDDVAILACGIMVARALDAAEALHEAGVSARVVNMASIAPLDEEAIRAAADLGAIVTVEEHSQRGGLGGAVAEVVAGYRPFHADGIGAVPVRALRSYGFWYCDCSARGDSGEKAMSEYVLAIDQGTTNTKALALDEEARIGAQASVPTPVAYPRPGWAEQSASDIWRVTREAIEGCLALLPEGARIAAIAISNQRETVQLWRRSTAEPIGPCVTWQCRRSAERIDALRTPEVEAEVAGITGLGLDPLFPAAKIGWLLDAYPETRRLAGDGDLCAGTMDSWLLFNLTGGARHATDASNASRTQLFALQPQAWSEELARLFGVPSGILPEVCDSNARFGETIEIGRLPAGVPIHAMMGDSHAALFGHGVRAPGVVKATYGTGSSLMTLTRTPLASRSGLSTTVAWRRAGEVFFALEGNISVSAQAAAWAADMMGLPDVAALTELAQGARGDSDVVFVPALAGLGAPRWNTHARAALTGMSLATSRAEFARAALDAIAHQIADVFAAMEQDLRTPLNQLSVDGGPTRNDLLMQIQSDLLGRPLRRQRLLELSAFGAGAMAGIACGLFGEAEAAKRVGETIDEIAPRLDEAARAARREKWSQAVKSVITAAGQ